MTNMILRIYGALSNCHGGIRSALFCLPVQILRCPCRLIDDTFDLSLRVARQTAHAFLYLAAQVLCGSGYAILIHLSSSVFALRLSQGR
jgi:hypothetical protein